MFKLPFNILYILVHVHIVYKMYWYYIFQAL